MYDLLELKCNALEVIFFRFVFPPILLFQCNKWRKLEGKGEIMSGNVQMKRKSLCV